jgi:hypothetical protein
MNTPTKPPKYTSQQIEEIIDRIMDLRMRWLRGVRVQLRIQEGRLGVASEAAEIV